jgi:hypothetical protein
MCYNQGNKPGVPVALGTVAWTISIMTALMAGGGLSFRSVAYIDISSAVSLLVFLSCPVGIRLPYWVKGIEFVFWLAYVLLLFWTAGLYSWNDVVQYAHHVAVFPFLAWISAFMAALGGILIGHGFYLWGKIRSTKR